MKEWGYDKAFVSVGLSYIESNLDDYSIKELAGSLAEYKKANPDCNYEPMSKEVIKLLTNIMEVDGKIDEREEVAIEVVSHIFKETNKIRLKKMLKDSLLSVSGGVGKVLKNGVIRNK